VLASRPTAPSRTRCSSSLAFIATSSSRAIKRLALSSSATGLPSQLGTTPQPNHRGTEVSSPCFSSACFLAASERSHPNSYVHASRCATCVSSWRSRSPGSSSTRS
jgi:hypothetical protein